MKRLRWKELDAAARRDALARPGAAVEAELELAVARVIEQVRADGDGAIRALTRRFDGVEVGDARVGEAEFARAWAEVPVELREAMEWQGENPYRTRPPTEEERQAWEGRLPHLRLRWLAAAALSTLIYGGMFLLMTVGAWLERSQ